MSTNTATNHDNVAVTGLLSRSTCWWSVNTFGCPLCISTVNAASIIVIIVTTIIVNIIIISSSSSIIMSIVIAMRPVKTHGLPTTVLNLLMLLHEHIVVVVGRHVLRVVS